MVLSAWRFRLPYSTIYSKASPTAPRIKQGQRRFLPLEGFEILHTLRDIHLFVKYVSASKIAALRVAEEQSWEYENHLEVGRRPLLNDGKTGASRGMIFRAACDIAKSMLHAYPSFAVVECPSDSLLRQCDKS